MEQLIGYPNKDQHNLETWFKSVCVISTSLYRSPDWDVSFCPYKRFYLKFIIWLIAFLMLNIWMITGLMFTNLIIFCCFRFLVDWLPLSYSILEILLFLCSLFEWLLLLCSIFKWLLFLCCFIFKWLLFSYSMFEWLLFLYSIFEWLLFLYSIFEWLPFLYSMFEWLLYMCPICSHV